MADTTPEELRAQVGETTPGHRRAWSRFSEPPAMAPAMGGGKAEPINGIEPGDPRWLEEFCKAKGISFQDLTQQR